MGFYSYDIILDGISGASQGIYPTRRISFPSPVKKYNELTIIGIDGKLYEETEFYDDIEITIEFNYMCNKDLWHETFRKCKKWILDARKIEISDDAGYYHKIKKVMIGTSFRESMQIGRFEVTFVLDPYYYLVQGLNLFDSEQCEFNSYDSSHPIYYIYGEGVCTLTVNKNVMIANVGQNIIIDTDRKISYRENGILENTSVIGDYTLFYLKETNEISITDGFILKIKPNWRVI